MRYAPELLFHTDFICHYAYMKQRLMKSMMASLEWRAIAFIVTNLFFWATTGEFWHATMLALTLHAILFVVHFGWYFVRETKTS